MTYTPKVGDKFNAYIKEHGLHRSRLHKFAPFTATDRHSDWVEAENTDKTKWTFHISDWDFVKVK